MPRLLTPFLLIIVHQGVSNASVTLVYLDAKALACKRSWCLFEIWTALMKHPERPHGGITFVTTNKTAEMTRIFSKIDVVNSTATLPADYDAILGKIRWEWGEISRCKS